MNRNSQYLEHNFYKMFMLTPDKLFNDRHILDLSKSEYSIEEIFAARYQPLFTENISNKQLFLKTLNELETLVAHKKKIKFNSKTKDLIIIKNQNFIAYYFNLLFSNKQKSILVKMLNRNYGLSAQENQDLRTKKKSSYKKQETYNVGDQDQNQQDFQVLIDTLTFIFKSLFKIQCKDNPQENQYNIENEKDGQNNKDNQCTINQDDL